MHNYLHSVNHSFVFDFERNFDAHVRVKWAKEHYRLPFYTVAAYLVTIYLLKNFMKSRPPMELKKPLFVWNTILAIISAIGIFRSYPVLFFDLSEFGFHFSVCDSSNANSVALFWAWVFVMCKFMELGDTVFVILRKHKLIFLHWYHHVTVLLSSWFVFGELAAPARWMATINTTVHAFMYTYYAVRALKIKVPKEIAMFITSLQILQMVVGAVICIYVGFSRLTGMSCTISGNVSNFLFIMYSTYLFLFVNFFYWTYLRPGAKTKIQKSS